MLENYPHLQKSRVKAHQRRTKSGKVVQVKEHQDRRSKKNPFDHAKYSFYNKKAEDFWKNNNKENRKKALEGAIPSINAKDWSNDNYENLSPMIRGKLYHYLESKKETPQQDTMKEDEKAVYEDEHKHRPDTMKVGDKVTFKSGGGDMEIIGIRDLFASDLKAYKVKNADGEIFFAEYSKDQLQLSEAKIAHSKGGYVEVGKWYLLNYGKWKDEVKVLSIDSKGMKVYNPKDNWKYSIPMTMIKKKKIGGYMTPIKESVNEGKKRFKVGFNIGKAKYVISHHDGRQKHKDGSDFFGISIYKNKKAFEKGQEDLRKKGYIEESVNEAKPKSYKFKFKCMECGKSFIKSLKKSLEVKCPKCKSVDIELENVNEATNYYKSKRKSDDLYYKKVGNKWYKSLASKKGKVKWYVVKFPQDLDKRDMSKMNKNKLPSGLKESVNEIMAGSQIPKTPTKKLVKIYKQMADERLSSGAALIFRMIAKELIKRKAKLEGSKDCCGNCKKGKKCCSVKSVNEDLGSFIKEKLLKKFGRDPLYAEFINAKNNKEMKKAKDTLISIRGPQALKKIQSYAKKLMEGSIDEGFGSPELMGEKDLAKFEKTRQKNAEVLGYKLTGRPDHKPMKEKIKVTSNK